MNGVELSTISFEKVLGSTFQIDILYNLLKKRSHNISHILMPTKDEHVSFVLSHPYRVWYLIKDDDEYIGSVYVLRNNCVGVSIVNDDPLVFTEVIRFILDHHRPLKEIKSIRPSYFYINVSPSNEKIKLQLDLLGAKKIQITYSLASQLIN